MDGEKTIPPQDKAETMSGDSNKSQLVNKLLCNHYTAAYTAHQIPDYTAHNHHNTTAYSIDQTAMLTADSLTTQQVAACFYYFCCDAVA